MRLWSSAQPQPRPSNHATPPAPAVSDTCRGYCSSRNFVAVMTTCMRRVSLRRAPNMLLGWPFPPSPLTRTPVPSRPQVAPTACSSSSSAASSSSRRQSRCAAAACRRRLHCRAAVLACEIACGCSTHHKKASTLFAPPLHRHLQQAAARTATEPATAAAAGARPPAAQPPLCGGSSRGGGGPLADP